MLKEPETQASNKPKSFKTFSEVAAAISVVADSGAGINDIHDP
jgi:hypothetical protein